MKHLLAFMTLAIFMAIIGPRTNNKVIKLKKISHPSISDSVTRTLAVTKNIVPEIKKDQPLKGLNKIRHKDLSSKLELEMDRAFDKLPGHHAMVKNVKAISQKSYTKDLGPIVAQNAGMVFVNSNGNHTNEKLANVIYDKNNNRFYPVSAVLKIEGIDEALRSEFKNDGFNEYYYHQELKTLFIQSTHTEVLGLYQDLISRGIVVYLEIIRGHNQQR